jgi:hypothetical protein
LALAAMKHVVLNREFGIVRTVAVFGPGRGGTSLIAGCLRGLGVCMGITSHAYKHEWSPIVRKGDGGIDRIQTHRIIQNMNENHLPWGWKFPSDVFHIEEITALLRHPGFIVVTRDLTEIALSSLTRQNVPVELSMYETATVFQYIASRIRFWPWPILIVPFAEALREPNALVEILCGFLQINPEEAKRKQAAGFVQPLTRGYRPFDVQPDQLHDFSPPADNLDDSRKLAIDFSARYSQEYLRHFEGLLLHARKAADRLAAKIRNPHDLAIASEVTNEFDDLFRAGVATVPGSVDLRLEKNGLGSPEKWRAAINRLLENLSTMAQAASKEALHSTGRYEALIRLHRALHLLIRVRAALDAGLGRIEFAAVD